MPYFIMHIQTIQDIYMLTAIYYLSKGSVASCVMLIYIRIFITIKIIYYIDDKIIKNFNFKKEIISNSVLPYSWAYL